MSIYKRCSRDELLDDGTSNPFICETSPRCEHVWHYYFRVNGRRYRASTETADKRQALNIEARERSRILDGRHGIRRQPDITFKAFAEIYLRDHADLHKRSAKRDREILKTLNRFFRVDNPPRNHVASHRTIQARPAERHVARVQAEEEREACEAGDGQPRARHAQIRAVEGRRMEVPRRFAGEGSQALPIAEPPNANSVTGRAAAASRYL